MLDFFFFFFNDTATTEIYTLSLHDALPICSSRWSIQARKASFVIETGVWTVRSEEHTSELQSLTNLVCRLLLEKKKNCSRFFLFFGDGAKNCQCVADQTLKQIWLDAYLIHA